MKGEIKDDESVEKMQTGLRPMAYAVVPTSLEPNMNDDRSTQLLQESLQGQAEALNQLLDNYRPYLLCLARDKLDHVVKQRLDASDIVQQTCLEVYRDIGTFQGTNEGQFKAWMTQILQHNVANAFRAHVQTKKRTTDKERALQGSGHLAPEILAARQSTPSSHAVRLEAVGEVQQQISQLPPDQSEAIRLRHLEGWTLRQLAAHFERSEVAVAGLLKRGMRNLRERLADHA